SEGGEAAGGGAGLGIDGRKGLSGEAGGVSEGLGLGSPVVEATAGKAVLGQRGPDRASLVQGDRDSDPLDLAQGADFHADEEPQLVGSRAVRRRSPTLGEGQAARTAW